MPAMSDEWQKINTEADSGCVLRTKSEHNSRFIQFLHAVFLFEILIL